MAERIMYVKPGCPYCQQAREALRAEGLDWEGRDAFNDKRRPGCARFPRP